MFPTQGGASAKALKEEETWLPRIWRKASEIIAQRWSRRVEEDVAGEIGRPDPIVSAAYGMELGSG